MLTRKDISRLLTVGLKTIFQAAYDGVAILYPEITTEVKSTNASEDYGWLGSTPWLTEWKDERAPKALLEQGFSLVNRDYEASIAVDRNAIDDDQTGMVKSRVQAMAVKARKSYDQLLATVIEANGLCYDGQNFFDTDHSEGLSGTQSNYTSSSAALALDKVKTIIQTMRGFKDDQGVVAGINPSHIMVPSGLEFTAKELFDPMYVSVTTDPSKATLKGLLKVIVNQYLTNAGTVANSAYYVMDMTQPVKPFIFQNRKELEFVALDDPSDIDFFMRKTLYYGVDARFAFGFGDWRTCFKAQG